MRRMCSRVRHQLCQLFNPQSLMLGLGFGIKNCSSLLAGCMVGLDIVFGWFGNLNCYVPKIKSKKSHPYVVQLPTELTSHSVEQFETDDCFLHTQLTKTKAHNSISKPNLQCCAEFGTWQRDGNEPCQIVCHMLWVHFVTDLESLLTDHTMSGRPIHSKYKHLFKDTLCANFGHFIWFHSSCLNCWLTKQGLETFFCYFAGVGHVSLIASVLRVFLSWAIQAKCASRSSVCWMCTC